MESASSETGSCPSLTISSSSIDSVTCKVNYQTHHPHYYHHLASQRKDSRFLRQQSTNSFTGLTNSLKNFDLRGSKGELVASTSTPLLNCDQVMKNTICTFEQFEQSTINKLSLQNQEHQQHQEQQQNQHQNYLQHLQNIKSHNLQCDEDRRKRTILIEKKNDSFGFTLQTYGIHHKKEGEVELLSYVDFVDVDGSAFRAGLREGDVILSINGQDMEKADHQTLVKFIKSCHRTMRMVVLFEDCVRKVNLHMKFLQLRKELAIKLSEYERLCKRETQILSGQKLNINNQTNLIPNSACV